MNDNRKVHRADLDRLRAAVREGQLTEMATRAFGDEPLIVAGILHRQKRIERWLREVDAPEELVDRIVREAYIMLIEPLLAIDGAHRAMWDSLLPLTQNDPDVTEPADGAQE